MGFALQSVSPPWSRTPFGAVALLLFSASRTHALRIRSSRCPEASGLCSPRRSVPYTDRGPPRPMLSWVILPLQSDPRTARTRLPGHFPHALFRPRLRESGGRCSRDLAHTRADGSLAGSTGSLEVFHQDLSSVLPMTVASCRINPTGSEWASEAEDHGFEAADAGRPEGRLAGHLAAPSCDAPREARGVAPPDGPSPHTTLSKRTFDRRGP